MINTTLYRQQCEAFFEENAIHADSIAEAFQGLDFDAQWDWYVKLNEMYDHSCLGVIRELVQQESSDVKNYREVFDAVWNERVETAKAIQDLNAQRRAQFDQEAQEAKLRVTIDGVQYRAEKAIDVLWCGWECDHTAWLVVINGERKLVGSDHGQQRVMDASFLEERIASYQRAIDESKTLLRSLTL